MERERITISIKKNILKEIDGVIDGIKVRNRSHAVETLAIQALNYSDAKNAVILMGGKDATKMIPVAESNIKLLKENGFDTVYIALGFLGDKIKQKLGDGSKFGVELVYLEEGEGSGGAVKQLKKFFNSTFLVFNGQETKIDLSKLNNFHKKQKNTFTIATSNLTNLHGIYEFESKIFDYIPNGFSMLENDILPKLLREEKAVIYPII